MFLAISQYGEKVVLHGKYPRKALLEYTGKRSAWKIYQDSDQGDSRHIGYGIGGDKSGIWYTIYKLAPMKEVSA